MPNGKKEIKVNFPEKLQAGVYANNMIISHTREEFIMDFLMVAPSAGCVTSRVVVSPGHVKRILAALEENIKRYESKYGKIQRAEDPKGKVGFQLQ
jgi:hypothetical protein